MNLNLKGYYNQINAFTVINQYPIVNTFTALQQEIYTGNIKLNTNFKFAKNTEAQFTAIYLAPDVIPQGTIGSRFSFDLELLKPFKMRKANCS